MKSIPSLNGKILNPTSGSFEDKALMIVNHPNDPENNREIEQMTLEDFFSDAGRVVVRDIVDVVSTVNTKADLPAENLTEGERYYVKEDESHDDRPYIYTAISETEFDEGKSVIPDTSDYEDADGNKYAVGTMWIYVYNSQNSQVANGKACKVYTLADLKVEEKEVDVELTEEQMQSMTAEEIEEYLENPPKETITVYNASWIDNYNIAYDSKEISMSDALNQSILVVEVENGKAKINYTKARTFIGTSGVTYARSYNPTYSSSLGYNIGDRWVNTVTGDVFLLSQLKLNNNITSYWKLLSEDNEVSFRKVERDEIHGAQNYDSEFAFGRLISDEVLNKDTFKNSTDFIELSNGNIIMFLNENEYIEDADRNVFYTTAIISKNHGNNWKPILKSNFNFNFKPSTYYETSDGTLYLSVESNLVDANKYVLLKSTDGGFSWLAVLYTNNKVITYINEDEYGNIVVHNTFNAWVIYHNGSYKNVDLNSNSIIKVIIYHRLYFVTPNATYMLNDDYSTTPILVKSVDAYESVLIDKIVCLFSENGVAYKTINSTFTPEENQEPFREPEYREIELDSATYVVGKYYTYDSGTSSYVLATGEFDSEETYYELLGTFDEEHAFGLLSGDSFDSYTMIGFDPKSLVAVMNNNTTGKIEFFDGKKFFTTNISKFITDGQIFVNQAGNAVYKNSCKFIGDFIFINSNTEGKIYIINELDYSILGSYESNVLPQLINDNIYLYGNDYSSLDIIPYNIYSTPVLEETEILVKSIKDKVFKLDADGFVTVHDNTEPENQTELKSLYTEKSQSTNKLFIHNLEVNTGAVVSGFDNTKFFLKYKFTPSDLHIIPYIITDQIEGDQMYVSVDMNFYKMPSYNVNNTYDFYIFEKYLIITEHYEADNIKHLHYYWIDITDMSNDIKTIPHSATKDETNDHYVSMDILNDKLYLIIESSLYSLDLIDGSAGLIVDTSLIATILNGETWSPEVSDTNSDFKLGCESGYLVIHANDTTRSKSYMLFAKPIPGKGLVHGDRIELANYTPQTKYDKVLVWHKFMYYILSDGKVYRKEINSHNLEEYLDSITDMSNCKVMDFVKNDKYCYIVVSDNETEETSLLVMEKDFIEYKIKLGNTSIEGARIFDMNHHIFIDLEYGTMKNDGDYYGHTYSYNHELYAYEETREGGNIKLVDTGCMIVPVQYNEDRFVIIKNILIDNINYLAFNNFNLENKAPFIEKDPQIVEGTTDSMIGLPTKGKLLPVLNLDDQKFIWLSFEYGIR